MAKDIKQVGTHIREILCLCGILDAEGGELNQLVGRTIQNHLVELNGGAGKPRLTPDESATNGPTTNEPTAEQPLTDEPPNNELACKPTTLESINDPAINKPVTMESLEASREALCREGVDEVMPRSALISPIEVDETTVGGIVESELSTITHIDGVAILNKYFPKSAIDSRHSNSAVVSGELPISVTDNCWSNSPLVPSIPSLAPAALSASLNIASKAPSICDLHQAIIGFETSIPNMGYLSRYLPTEIRRAARRLRLIVPTLTC